MQSYSPDSFIFADSWSHQSSLSPPSPTTPLQLDYSPSHPHPQQRREEDGLANKSAAATPYTRPAEKRVPRPRNAFMIYRSAFWAQQKINPTVERDHRHISRIIGYCWKKLSEQEKDVWRHKADQEKVEHELKHPGYRFSPTARTKKPVKRRVKRNGAEDLLRCKQVAELLLSGKQGDDLAEAVKSLKVPEDRPPSLSGEQSFDAEPPFRSPLLPPAPLSSCTPSPSRMDENRSDHTLSNYDFYTPTHDFSSQHIMVTGRTPPSESLLFQDPQNTVAVAPLAYAIYEAQCNPISSFDLSLDPMASTLGYYDAYGLCHDPSTIPPLPAPHSRANIMAQPLEWNLAFPFSS